MIPEYVGEIVDIVIEVVIGDDGGGKAFEVLTMEVSIVDVSMVDVTKDSLLCIPASMLTFVPLLDKSKVMYRVSTSYLSDSICETPDGLISFFSGILMFS